MIIREQVADELDRRFDAFLQEEAGRMRAAGMGEALIAATAAENRDRYARDREAAISAVVGANDNDLATTRPPGCA